jgi:hypothetical protein
MTYPGVGSLRGDPRRLPDMDVSPDGHSISLNMAFSAHTSVIPVPDGTETQEMCPREFPQYQRFPQYSGFR